MLVKTEGIVLQNIRYADKKVISKIYTKNFGLVTVNAITSSAPTSKTKAATIQALNQVEISLVMKQNREVQQLIEARSLVVYNSLRADYHKLAIAQFLNEVLCKCVKEQIANEPLFNFITLAYRHLDKKETAGTDFHIYFLFELSRFLGFEPHNTYNDGNIYFDTREGKFTSMSLGFPLGFDKDRSKLFLELFDADLIHKRFSRQQRNELLDILLAYYKMQIEGFNDLRSYAVLKEMFAAT